MVGIIWIISGVLVALKFISSLNIGLSRESQMEYEIEEQEKREMDRSNQVASEKLPKTQEGFKNSCMYTLEKFLG